MPQEPKKRHSRQRQGKRRASISFSISNGIKCLNCGSFNIAHTVCKTCGFYKGKQIIIKQEKKKRSK